MAFVDEVTIHAKAGRGGNGVVRWLRTKETARGGPSGGDGGKGGDVALVGVRDYSALAHYRNTKIFIADNGKDGMNTLKHGADGGLLVLPVPIGTIAEVVRSGEVYDIIIEGERVIVLKGGRGGKGNARFKSSTHQNPFEQTDGKEGEESDIKLTLKIIADAGIIGLPNAGKSSLLNALTRAKSKIGSYPFTTLEPNLGDFYGHTLADIPGLIEGASSGRGLGIKFLKHIERTGILLHLVSADHDDPLTAYREVRREIELFSPTLANKQEIIILSKIDLITRAELEIKMELFRTEFDREVLSVSVNNQQSLKDFSDRLIKALN